MIPNWISCPIISYISKTVIKSTSDYRDIFFDQLVLRFTRGNLKEEAHYYPHGLPIAGMGSAAHGFVENRRKYQGNEYIKDLGLNWMDFQARQYDPQLGRFLAVDPLADKYGQQINSPYAAMDNDPIRMIDPNGQNSILSYDDKTKTLTVTATVYFQGSSLPKNLEDANKFMEQLNEALRKIYSDGEADDGTKVVFNITAKLNNNITPKDLKDGENIMTVDYNNPGLIMPGGDKRANVKGPMGYIMYAVVDVATHEMGHMFGLKDRYTDYKNPENEKEWASIIHAGYKNDIMGRGKEFSQQHYNDYIYYYNFNLNQVQKHLLPQYRSKTLTIPSGSVGGNTTSSVAEEDIPGGWIIR